MPDAGAGWIGLNRMSDFNREPLRECGDIDIEGYWYQRSVGGCKRVCASVQSKVHLGKPGRRDCRCCWKCWWSKRDER